MQQDFRSHSHFSQRTEKLASELGVLLRDLPELIGISERMLYGYRSGKYPLSDKAWRKLEALEAQMAADRSFRSDDEMASESSLDEEPSPYRVRSSATIILSQDQISEGLQLLSRIACSLERIAASRFEKEMPKENTP